MAQGRAIAPRIDTDTGAYFTELKQHFDQLKAGSEEQELLVGNALAEAAGKELAVACDGTCSRVLEALLPRAALDQLEAFLTPLLAKAGGFVMLCTSPFGSHVAERMVEIVGRAATSEGDLQATGQRVLETLTNEFCANMAALVADRFGTHVGRLLLCVVAGQDIAPKSQSSAKPARRGALAAAPGLAQAAIAQPPAQPELLQRLTQAVQGCAAPQEVHELVYHPQGSPFLQALLRVHQGNTEQLEQLIPDLLGAGVGGSEASGQEGPLPGMTQEYFKSLLCDFTASHFMEAVFIVAPSRLARQLFSAYLQNNLPELSVHLAANFVVQAALTATRDSATIREALTALSGKFKELLEKRRAGVVASLIAACAREGVQQAAACQALAAAVRELNVQDAGLAEALLTLDTPLRLTGSEASETSRKARLSPMGCSIMASVLSMSQEACQPFATSLQDLPAAALLRVGLDSAGSRVLEACIRGGAAVKTKKKLLRKLTGLWGQLALQPGGSHVVQACFTFVGAKGKAVIAEELLPVEVKLVASSFGTMLLRRCSISDYRKGGKDWLHQEQSKAHTKHEFEQLFGQHQN